MSNQLFKKLLFLISFSLILLYLLFQLGTIADIAGYFLAIISPFLAGCLMAAIINIPMRFFEKKLFSNCSKSSLFYRAKRGLSLILTISFLTLLLFSVFKLVFPVLVDTIAKIAASIPGAVEELNIWLLNHGFDSTELIDNLSEQTPLLDPTPAHISEFLMNYANRILFTTTDLVSGIFSGVTHMIIAICFSMYLLFAKETLSRQCKKMLYAFCPSSVSERCIEVGRLSINAFCDFFSGQFIEACILGTLIFLSMTILKLPYAVLISVFIGILSMIPIFGAFVGCFVGALFIIMVEPIQAVIFVILFLTIQQIEDNFVYPHIVGKRVGLPAIWVLVAVFVGGGLFGVLGMLLSIPFFSVVYRLIKEYTQKKLEQKQIDPQKWL